MNDPDPNSTVFNGITLQGDNADEKLSINLAITLSVTAGLGALLLFFLWTRALSVCDRCI